MCHQRFWRSPGALATIKAPDRPTRSGDLRPGTSISQYGITWTFRDTHLTGQFLNGDYWIVGPVEIIGISPIDARVGADPTPAAHLLSNHYNQTRAE